MLSLKPQILLLFALAMLSALLLSCAKRASPEEAIRSLVEQAVQLAQQRDAKPLLQLVSDDYHDSEDRDKKTIRALLVYHFRQNRSIYLLKRIKSLKLIDPNNAELTVVVAAAGEPFGNDSDGLQIQADVWRVMEATWVPVEITEFL